MPIIHPLKFIQTLELSLVLKKDINVLLDEFKTFSLSKKAEILKQSNINGWNALKSSITKIQS